MEPETEENTYEFWQPTPIPGLVIKEEPLSEEEEIWDEESVYEPTTDEHLYTVSAITDPLDETIFNYNEPCENMPLNHRLASQDSDFDSGDEITSIAFDGIVANLGASARRLVDNAMIELAEDGSYDVYRVDDADENNGWHHLPDEADENNGGQRRWYLLPNDPGVGNAVNEGDVANNTDAGDGADDTDAGRGVDDTNAGDGGDDTDAGEGADDTDESDEDDDTNASDGANDGDEDDDTDASDGADDDDEDDDTDAGDGDEDDDTDTGEGADDTDEGEGANDTDNGGEDDDTDNGGEDNNTDAGDGADNTDDGDEDEEDLYLDPSQPDGDRLSYATVTGKF